MYSEIHLPKGFKCAGIAAGIKPASVKDMALILSERPAASAGVFTTNQVCAAPVKVCRAHLAHGVARAIVMNSGIANACTGSEGMVAAKDMAAEAAKVISCEPQEIFVCSTGKIGPQLPLDKIIQGIGTLFESASIGNVQNTAEAMMTTDTRPKVSVAEIVIEDKPVKIVGFAKGAGMIEPNMATMLSYITTDAAVEQHALQAALKKSVDGSFNRISIDGDQSTNDTVLALANGAAENRLLDENSPEWNVFFQALEKVCFELAMMIVHDGEGADKFVTVKVTGAASNDDAELAARAVANSMLNKTAWAGTYPDWGRIMDSVGYSKAQVVEERVDIFYDDTQAVAGGCQSGVAQEDLIKVVSQSDFAINIDLHLGGGEAVVYTCNCTEEYVRINY
ncbi:bifunctional glutamate N-acetyltransferase/amino-acid acetyltransferase ArgJ [Pontiella agarivorans]|uniref:Arginine biosynthesis bifunctional protein ArgJ n=1 Tax=Pontiella agarivorans TaxID=3038953 RepID=A0ABU5MZ29_9BACT|nr:bifunctional glutamate N-acetyltransferase/amino-acid acetyltransferase ArgJ [Pontiella agarivorans]MDZ8119414.1 bifunctional glutamate N-acetyltransferase/amino-acid acetyltransferase ArgJ [Pontiella agarivorans]